MDKVIVFKENKVEVRRRLKDGRIDYDLRSHLWADREWESPPSPHCFVQVARGLSPTICCVFSRMARAGAAFQAQGNSGSARMLLSSSIFPQRCLEQHPMTGLPSRWTITNLCPFWAQLSFPILRAVVTRSSWNGFPTPRRSSN